MKKIINKQYTKIYVIIFILVISIFLVKRERSFIEETEEVETLQAIYELKEDPEIFLGDEKIELSKDNGEQKVLVRRVYTSEKNSMRTPHRTKKGYYLKEEKITGKEITKEPKNGLKLIGTKEKSEQDIKDEKLREGKQLSVGFVEDIYFFNKRADSEYNKMEITIKDAVNNKYKSPKAVMVYRGSKYQALRTENEINRAMRENTIESIGDLYDRNGLDISKVFDFEEDYTYYLISVDSDVNTGVVGVRIFKD